MFRLIARGFSNAEISRGLYISDTTVKTHITHILQKLNLREESTAAGGWIIVGRNTRHRG